MSQYLQWISPEDLEGALPYVPLFSSATVRQMAQFFAFTSVLSLGLLLTLRDRMAQRRGAGGLSVGSLLTLSPVIFAAAISITYALFFGFASFGVAL